VKFVMGSGALRWFLMNQIEAGNYWAWFPSFLICQTFGVISYGICSDQRRWKIKR